MSTTVSPFRGPTTKIHLARDGHGRPLSVLLTAGNVNDCTRFTDVMAGIRFDRGGPGRPRTRPNRVIADKGYSSRTIRGYLRRRGIPAPFPNAPTSKPTELTAAARAVAHRPSTPTSTNDGSVL